MTAAGVLVALGAAVTTLVLVGPDAGLVGGPLGDVGTATQQPQVQELPAAGPSPVAGRAAARECWDGASVAAVRDCDVPAGRAGLATVFAGVRDGCRVTEPEVAGKLEVVTCRSSDHVVRYTRWTAGFDRFSWFDDEHAGRGTRWRVGGEFAGRTWTASEQTADGVTHDRWTATYRAWPLSVEVQATTTTGRAAGVAEVGAIAPTLVGLG